MIAHNSGLLKGDEHENEIRDQIQQLTPAFCISNWHYIGECVEINKDALPPLIEEWSSLTHELFKRAHQIGITRDL